MPSTIIYFLTRGNQGETNFDITGIMTVMCGWKGNAMTDKTRFRVILKDGQRKFTWALNEREARLRAEAKGFEVKRIELAPNPLVDR